LSFLLPGFNDIVDIIIIAFIIYQCLVILKKTSGYQFIYGFLILIIVLFLATILNLRMVSGLLSTLKNFWILILVILFQQEIRDVFSKLNISSNLFERKNLKNVKEFNSVLIDAISAMSFRRIGAIIVLEKKRQLTEYIKAGELIDSVLSLRLILSIFNTKSVLHDGAIVIRNNRIMAAKVVLPLSQNLEYKKKYGTRHLAAIGISEITDSLIIVISEQTGHVSIAQNGVLKSNIAFEELMQIIIDAT